jgi:hypothetical protein
VGRRNEGEPGEEHRRGSAQWAGKGGGGGAESTTFRENAYVYYYPPVFEATPKADKYGGGQEVRRGRVKLIDVNKRQFMYRNE